MVKSRSSLQTSRRAAASLPSRILVELAVLEKEAPDTDDWLHEVKFDGYRMLARLDDGRARLITRNDQDWTVKFPELAEEFTRFGRSGTVLDGEIVKLADNGISSFAALQDALSKEQTADLVYVAFDLLFLDGEDLRGLPLEERKRRLSKLLAKAPGTIRVSEHRVGGGKALYKQACQLRLEGIISKRRESVYTGTRSDDWLKVKCLNTEEFIIIGYTEPQRSRVGFGALLVGYYTPDGEIRYAGKVGTGYSREFLIDFQKRLGKIEQAKPTATLPKGTYMRAKVHWVKPKFLAQVEFTEWTRDRILRHPAFLGLREDKDPREVVIATESPSS
ncbi:MULTISPECIES: non-homologous end-joining DNA ligase [Microvirga]|uniref:non-homologous end-joining DNA ligase n=1 Tax=Microvirga TaxID=186650 RepID=UPI0021C93C6C|nr:MULTISPECIES: non-homologous end-joining DNA ligase [unclassified Microvirga]